MRTLQWLLLVNAGLAISILNSPCAAAPRAAELDQLFFQYVVQGGEGLDVLLDPAFKYKTTQNTLLSGNQLIQHLKQGKTKVSSPQIELKMETQSENSLVTNGRLTLHLHDGRGTRPVQSEYTHVWVQSGSNWRLLFREARLIKTHPEK